MNLANPQVSGSMIDIAIYYYSKVERWIKGSCEIFYSRNQFLTTLLFSKSIQNQARKWKNTVETCLLTLDPFWKPIRILALIYISLRNIGQV